MDSSTTIIADIFTYYPTYSMLICTSCPKVLTKREATSHLKIHFSHSELQANDWLGMISNLEIQTWAKSLDLIRQVEPIPPINGLEIKNGLRCQWTACKSLFLVGNSIYRHLLMW
jgi:hypothetical protein